MNLDGKIALVTGGGRGIGNGCALALARAGADIVLNERPGSPDGSPAADAIRQLRRRCWLVEADVFCRAGRQSLVDAAIDGAGRIDILISNPALSRRGDFLDDDDQWFEQTLQGTLTSGFHLAQLVGRHRVQQGGAGKIVFISSIHGEMPLARSAAYNAAKAGLNHLMRTIAGELIGHRINVNAIAPGWIDTPGERAVFANDVIAQAGQVVPWGRIGTPEDIGQAALFLCSPAADYITGQVLTVDGGLSLAGCLGPFAPPRDSSS